MPKRQTIEDASSSWVDAHFTRWHRDRGSPREAKRTSEGVSSASGDHRPVFEEEGLTAEEAKMYWRELTNMAFTVPGHFEPQQYLSFVAGRPVVATRGNNANTPLFVNKFLLVRSAGQAIAFYNTVKVSGEGITRN